jgi:hypothetical protein
MRITCPAATLTAAVLALPLVALSAGPAAAVGDGNPVIVAPADQAEVSAGFTGPFTVDFSDSAVGSYEAMLWCSDYMWSDHLTYDGVTNVRTFSVPAIPDDEDCGLSVDSDDDQSVISESEFFTLAKPFTFGDVELETSTLYSMVRDGYLDSTMLHYELANANAHVTVTVTDATGYRLRTVDRGEVSDWDEWTWAGRRDDGTVAPAGVYTIAVSGVDAQGYTASFARSVTIKHRQVPDSRSVFAAVMHPTRVVHHGTCRYRKAYAGSIAHPMMRCRGGRRSSSITASYRMRLPASAFDVTWRWRGAYPSWDRHPGTIRWSGKATDARHVTVTGKASRHRSVVIYSVRADYNVWKWI